MLVLVRVNLMCNISGFLTRKASTDSTCYLDWNQIAHKTIYPFPKELANNTNQFKVETP